MIEANEVLEDVDLSGSVIHMESVLDTLYDARSVSDPPITPRPTMTWYHGRLANRFVFSGFAPWDFRRDDCIALSDFVLQDLWGLAPPARRPAGPRRRTSLRPAAPRTQGPRPDRGKGPVTPAAPRR
jgi:hypothetical protein